MGALLDIVGAMRSLASMRVQEASRAQANAGRYAAAMASAIGSALQLVPDEQAALHRDAGRRALILCTSEQGFVGGFNERLLDAACAIRTPSDVLFILGSRGAVRAQERGLVASWMHPMATRLASVPASVRRLTEALYKRVGSGEIGRVELMFTRARQGQAATIEHRKLFPLDLTALATQPARLPPLHNLSPQLLLEQLIVEYVFALLTEAAIDSLASESAARFTAMAAAHDNVSRKLDHLRQEARQARQDEITMELLDLVTGAEAARL